jgi:hypothetical protein
MKSSWFAASAVLALLALGAAAFGVESSTSPYSDATGDISSDIQGGNPGNGILDITGMEVSVVGSDLVFNLSVAGDIAANDWGNYMIGIGSYNEPLGTVTGNAWNRPINLQYTPNGFPTQAGMDYWIGSWVGGGGGSQLWTWDGAAWTGPASLAGFTFTPGTPSTISYTVSLASLGLSPGQQFSFDAYSSGGPNPDGAIDSLANPNVTVSTWDGAYTSLPVAFGGGGLNTFTVPVPEPSAAAMVATAVMGGCGVLIRRRRRRC